MAMTIEALSTSVVVRRVGRGAGPFRWEIHWTDMEHLIHASPARFGSMDAAYTAGAAQLAAFHPKALGATGRLLFNSRFDGLDGLTALLKCTSLGMRPCQDHAGVPANRVNSSPAWPSPRAGTAILNPLCRSTNAVINNGQASGDWIRGGH